MRIFVCEFITGGGFHDTSCPTHLIREGTMMLTSVLQDIQALGITDIVTTLDQKLNLNLPGIQVIPIADQENIYAVWNSCMQAADSVLIIAPESDDILYKLIYMAEQSNCQILGSASHSIKTASSKLATTELLTNKQIPCLETIPLDHSKIPQSHSGWIVKPDDGIGGEHCYFYADKNALKRHKNNNKKYIVQKYLQGTSASLSIACHQGTARLLACNQQIVDFSHGTCMLKKIIVNGLSQHWQLFDILSQRIADADHGLSGYIGIDIIMHGSEISVLEINPRLTTSYVGIKKSIDYNPMRLMLHIAQKQTLPILKPYKKISPISITVQAD